VTHSTCDVNHCRRDVTGKVGCDSCGTARVVRCDDDTVCGVVVWYGVT